MSENSSRYSYVQFTTLITFIVIFLGFIGEVFKHQTRQIRYTRNQLYKIGKTFYITRVSGTTANTIRGLSIRQIFRTRRRDRNRKRGKREAIKYVRPWDTNQGIHGNLLIPLERHHKTYWNPSISELMLTNIQLLKPKINMIIHTILQHKLDICFITETWFSKNEDLQYIKANLNMQGYNILSCERENRKGGSLACIYNEKFKVKSMMSQNYKSFESLIVQWNINPKQTYFHLSIDHLAVQKWNTNKSFPRGILRTHNNLTLTK